MNRKERREIARKIAKYEKVIQKSESKETIKSAQDKINEIIMSTNFDLEDMAYIDELVQKNLA